MFLEALVLRNFRNHQDLELAFSPKVNLILGDNGIGKTNILEAIYFFSTGKSFRTSQLMDLIRWNYSHFYIEAHFVKDNVSQTLKVGYDGRQRKIEYNTSISQSFSHLLGILPAVLYCPKDISLIMGAPEDRRHFLNLYLGQSDPMYVYHLIRYNQALKQRNALLKQGDLVNSLEICCFEQELASSACYLMQKRLDALRALEQKLQLFTCQLTAKNCLFNMRYIPSFSLENGLSQEVLISQYARQRKKEMILKTSLIGPHRDDFSILLDGQSVKSFCSEGQKRVFLSALKMAEWSLLQEHHQQLPLMCVDDLGIHLDDTRHTLLEKQLGKFGQVFLTSPQKSFEHSLGVDHHVLAMG